MHEKLADRDLGWIEAQFTGCVGINREVRCLALVDLAGHPPERVWGAAAWVAGLAGLEAVLMAGLVDGSNVRAHQSAAGACKKGANENAATTPWDDRGEALERSFIF